MIERVRGAYTGRNRSSAYKDLVWTVATAQDTRQNIEQQTLCALATIERNLVKLGAGKDRIVSAQIYIASMTDKARMDKIGANGSVPTRITGRNGPAWVWIWKEIR